MTVLSKLLHRIYHKRYYLFFCAKGAPTRIEHSNELLVDLTIEHFQNDEIFSESNRKEKFISRLSDGHKCLGFLDENKKVKAYFWISDSKVIRAPFTFGLNLKIPPTILYIWDCRTATDFQRKGLYQTGLLKIREAHQDKQIIINCDFKNINSIKGIEKSGFHLCGHISAYLYLRRFNLWRKNNKWPEFYCKSIDMGTLID